MTIRRLQRGDGPILAQLRLAALRDSPDNFVANLSDFEGKTSGEWEDVLAGRAAFAAFVDQRPVGLAAFVRDDHGRTRHRARLVHVWVEPDHRGTGIAARLLAVLEVAAIAEGVLQLELEVNADNTAAVSFYTRLGYDTVGRMPWAFRTPRGYVDEFIMVKQLAKT